MIVASNIMPYHAPFSIPTDDSIRFSSIVLASGDMHNIAQLSAAWPVSHVSMPRVRCA